MSLFRPTIDALTAYEPGEQPAPGAEVIKLNTNENPYPPSDRVLAALRTTPVDDLRRYPSPAADIFRECAASVLGVDPSWIVVGNGSDDLLTMVFRSITHTDRPVTYPVPTYVLYRTLAQIQDAPIVEVPFDDAYALPVDALVAAGAALTIIASPNSPSGNSFSNTELQALAQRAEGVLVIDEAYAEFATTTALELTRRCQNVIVLRTLSKSHSLAGLRLGFAVASPSLVTGLMKVKDSYNVDAVAARVGAAAMADVEHTQRNVARIRGSRERLSKSLAGLGYRVWPSDANFLLAQPPAGNAKAVYEALRSEGILVRFFDTPELKDRLRITVGTDEHNERLLEMLRVVGEHVSPR